MKKLSAPFFLLAVVLVLYSCSKDKKQNLPAAISAKFANVENCTCEPFAQEYQWRGQTVYLFSCAGPACDCITLYYDEKGQQITMATGYRPGHFQQEALFLREIWRCKP